MYNVLHNRASVWTKKKRQSPQTAAKNQKPDEKKCLLVHTGQSKYRPLFLVFTLAASEDYSVDDALEDVDNLVVLL